MLSDLVFLSILLGVLLVGSTSAVGGGTPPSEMVQEREGLTGVDLGETSLPGSADLQVSGTALTVEAAGRDLWDREDEAYFVQRMVRGDGVVVARIEALVRTDEWAKAGIMFREELASDSRNVCVVWTPRSLVALQYRSRKGDLTNTKHVADIPSPVWLKLERFGARFSASVSLTGVRWRHVGQVELDLPDVLHAGVVVTSHQPSKRTTAIFTGVDIRHILNLGVVSETVSERAE